MADVIVVELSSVVVISVPPTLEFGNDEATDDNDDLVLFDLLTINI